MAEIKSAIELAMERTKGLVMDEKEKEQSLIQDAENKLKVLVRRFLESGGDIDDFRSQYDRIDLKENRKRSLLIDIVVEGFDAGGDAKSFQLLHVAGGNLDKRLSTELDKMQRQFSEALDKKSEDVRKRILSRLKKMGISGSALEPNVSAWDEWKEAAVETKQAFDNRLRKWKDEVKAATA